MAGGKRGGQGGRGAKPGSHRKGAAQVVRNAKVLKVADRRRPPPNAKVTRLRGRPVAPMPLALP